jgi:hypothetical protein
MTMRAAFQTIPLLVRLRTFCSHAGIAAITLAAYVILFQFLAGSTAKAIAELRRVEDSPNNEIVFAGEPNEGEVFYYLRNYSLLGSNQENAVSDILMVRPDTVYEANTISFNGTLAEGTCAVSANVAHRYGLSVGEYARIIGTEHSFRVASILPPQDGLDEDFRHEGIVVIAYEPELLDKSYRFVSFCTDGDGYNSLISLVFVPSLAEGLPKALCLYAAAALAVLLLTLLVCERFLFVKRRADYRCLVTMGVGKGRLTLLVFGENLLKYALPLCVVAVLYAAFYGCYGLSYALPATLMLLICIAVLAIESWITVRRICYVRAK